MIAAYEDIQPGAFLREDNRPLAVVARGKLTVALDSPRNMSGLRVAQVAPEPASAGKDAKGLLSVLPEKWRAKGVPSRQQAREGQGKGRGRGLGLPEKTSSGGVVAYALYSFLSSFNMLSERV